MVQRERGLTFLWTQIPTMYSFTKFSVPSIVLGAPRHVPFDLRDNSQAGMCRHYYYVSLGVHGHVGSSEDRRRLRT